MKKFKISKGQIVSFFKDHDLLHYASSLSFHTILALIPVLLISLTIFTHLPSFEEYYDKIKNFIFSALIPSHQDMIANYIDKFMQNTLSMGIIGFIFVIYVSIMFFDDYEYVVSKIFHTKPRGFWHSISVYWTLVTMAPLALGISFYISSYVQKMLNSSQYTSWIDFLSFFPFLIIWFLFFVAYMISANVEIKTKNALISSLIFSSIWYLSKNLFIYYVFYNKTYLTIYGSFSAIMFFLIWIYLSWIIFLYGLKLCYILNQKDSKQEDKNIKDNFIKNGEKREQNIEN